MAPQLPTIGFVILSHVDDGALHRLVATLNMLYDDPPIACHHDFSQAALDTDVFPGNVHFVRPSFRTGWGTFPVVEAGLAALSLLYEKADPDWFFHLSAADYPVMPAARVRQELRRSGVDAYVDARALAGHEGEARRIGQDNPKLTHFDLPSNVRLKWLFYFGRQLWIPIIRRKPRWRIGRHTFRPALEARHPFRDGFACFYGDHWYTANRRAARLLLNPTSDHLRLQRHLCMRPQADECYYQTVLCNAAELAVDRDNRRFAEWNGGGAHPVVLTDAQLEEARLSGAHFARKFKADSPVLERLDALLASE